MNAEIKLDTIYQIIRVCRHFDMRCNSDEIALLAKVPKRSMHDYGVRDYWVINKDIASDEDIQAVRDRAINIGISKANNAEKMLGVVLGTHLKVETNILADILTFQEAWKIGTAIVKLYRQTCNYKNNPVPIHSTEENSRFILRRLKNTCHMLFQRSKTYKVQKIAKFWQPTPLLDRYISQCTNTFLLFQSQDGKRPLGPHMFAKNNVKHVYIGINEIKNFEINSIFHLLMSTVEITGDTLIVAIRNESCTDEALGRSYNVFCRIRSAERLRLGYFAYDMNAALQSISLQLIKASQDDFPMLWKYTHDKEYKKSIRSEIAKDLKTDISEVKERLTAFANGSARWKSVHRHYKAFHEESDRLRREVLKYVAENEPEVLKRATAQSKKSLPEELDWLDTESKEISNEARAKASVFFFVWTWYERQIRQAMLTVLTDGIELHDAVYSKKNMDANIIEKAVYEITGFDIIIDVESPES